ncbi:MAG: hypothetical protein ACK4MM_05235 [Fervidobacterium sp.]
MRIDSTKFSKKKKYKLFRMMKNIIILTIFLFIVILGFFEIYNLTKTSFAFANGSNKSQLEKNRDSDGAEKLTERLKDEIIYSQGLEVRFHKAVVDNDKIIVVGTILENAENKYDILILSFDKHGNKQWETKFGGRGDDWGYDIVETSDGKYLVVATTSSKEYNVKGRYDALVIKIGKDGNVIWHKTYGGPDWDRTYKIVKLNAGYVIVGDNFMKGGDVTENFGEHDFWIVKIDEDGKIIWDKSFGGIRWDRAYSADYNEKSNTVFVAGSSNSFTNGINYDGYVVAYNTDGKELWKSLLTNSRTIWPFDISLTDDAIYIAGYAVEENNKEKAFISKLSKLGEVIFVHTFGENCRIQSIKAVKNNDKTIIYFSGYKDIENTKKPWAGQVVVSEDNLSNLSENIINSEYGFYFSTSLYNELVLYAGSIQINGKMAGIIKIFQK